MRAIFYQVVHYIYLFGNQANIRLFCQNEQHLNEFNLNAQRVFNNVIHCPLNIVIK